MSIKKYSCKKSTGNQFISEIPEEWDILPLKHLVDTSRSITYGIVQAGPHVEEGIPYIRPVDMTEENGIAEPQGILRTSPEIAMAYERSKIKEGDLVCSIGPSFGKVMTVPSWLEGANLTQGTARVAIRKGIALRFIFWCLRSATSVSQWESSIGGATFRALNLGPLAETDVPKPSTAEQIAIASFLDHETAKIDTLIAEQQRLIELLQEKRQAVISHAVTKGLNPNAPMKASGVEWVGEVPEHWDVVQIKWLSPVKRGASPRPIEDPKYFDDCGEYAWVRISDVSSSSGRLEATSQYLSELGSRLSVKLEPGSLFVSIAGSVGKPCITRIKACIHDGFVYFPSLQACPEFLELIFISGGCFGGLGKLGTQLNLNTDTIGAIRIGIPTDDDEVNAIVEYCNQISERFSELEAAALSAVSLLSERRSALISAAVTGQIDVRGMVTEAIEK